jgi:hypothetical protein
MPWRFALHRAEVDARYPSKYAKQLSCVLVILGAVTLAGCNDTTRGLKASNTGVVARLGPRTAVRPGPRTAVPLPRYELLKPPPDFKCEFETVDPKPDALRKLDYERQCYRHASMILRARLDHLQGSVDKTIKAIKRKRAKRSTTRRP